MIYLLMKHLLRYLVQNNFTIHFHFPVFTLYLPNKYNMGAAEFFLCRTWLLNILNQRFYEQCKKKSQNLSSLSLKLH